MTTPCVYILASKPNGTLYIGVTSNLVQRVWEHKNDFTEGFTKRYQVHDLVWYEVHDFMESAIGREKALKKLNRAWKIRLIEEGNSAWSDLYEQILQEVDAVPHPSWMPVDTGMTDISPVQACPVLDTGPDSSLPRGVGERFYAPRQGLLAPFRGRVRACPVLRYGEGAFLNRGYTKVSVNSLSPWLPSFGAAGLPSQWP